MRPKPSQAPGLSPVLQRPRGEPPELLRREHQAPPRSVTGPCPTRFDGLWRRCDNTLEKILNGRLEDARCFATIGEDEDRCVADIGGETFEGQLSLDGHIIAWNDGDTWYRVAVSSPGTTAVSSPGTTTVSSPGTTAVSSPGTRKRCRPGARSPGVDLEAQSVFNKIHKDAFWSNLRSGTTSGPGSSVKATTGLCQFLGEFIKSRNVQVFLDIPCGDCNWQANIPGLDKIKYFGFDISEVAVQRAIETNSCRSYMKLGQLDIFSRVPMEADVIMVKDAFQHWPLDRAQLALRNIRKSGTKLLLATTFPTTCANKVIKLGRFYKCNLQLAPFDLGPPIVLRPQFEYHDASRGHDDGAHIGLWRFPGRI